jgi:tetratricopeptide (TPR) repeat protein
MPAVAVRALAVLLAVSSFLLGPGVAAAGSAGEPGALLEALEASRLDPARAVALKGVELDTGLARFVIESGTIVPTVPIGVGALELAFVGRGRLVLEAPDEIEAGQLELFTGSRSLDEVVTEAIFVVGNDAAAAAILSRAAATPEATLLARATQILADWRESPERRALGVEQALLLDALGEPAYDTFFAGWFRGEALGEFLYAVEPGSSEQVTLGRFEPFELTEKQERKIDRELHREQRRGRLIGLRVDDLGTFDTWLSAPRSGPDGAPAPDTSPFEPERYVLDARLEGRALELAGKARVELRAVTGSSRAVTFQVNPALQVRKARGGDGGELFFHQVLGWVRVVLPEAPAAGETLVVELDYGGAIVEKLDTKSFVLLDTITWYPHAGAVDRALYEVTLHWPDHLDLVAAGRRLDGGKESGGMRWERRALERPTFGYSFEIGRYRTKLSGKAGHVTVDLHVDYFSEPLLRRSREEILQAVIDALAYFEETLGPHPLDQLTVVTAPRDFSQSLLGFVTLSTLMVADELAWLGFEDYRTVIAHEIAHQWWGHQVGWKSYRDQWISEAAANYSAVLFARNRLKSAGRRGPTAGWQRALTRTTADGRALESVGPLVLGQRLLSTRGGGAYEPIIYRKGAVVLDMLARTWGEEQFVKLLKAIVEAAGFRPISTEDFLALVERITGHDMDPFARQFIYGTGLPEVYYTYSFEEKPEGGGWVVAGRAWQQSPYRFRYRVAEGPGGRLDVARETLEQIEVAESQLVVPVYIAYYDAAQDEGGRRRKGPDPREVGNAMLRGHTLLAGPETPFRFELQEKPTEVWFDRDEEVFGRFFNERRHPKRIHYYQGLDHDAAGRLEEAERAYRKALEAPTFAGADFDREIDPKELEEQGRILDRRILRSLARLCLGAGRDAEAEAHLERGERLAKKDDPWWLEEDLRVLRARLALRRGEPREAYDLLRKKVLRDRVWDDEGLAALAIAARAVGDEAEYRAAVEDLDGSGVDLSRLTGGS